MSTSKAAAAVPVTKKITISNSTKWILISCGFLCVSAIAGYFIYQYIKHHDNNNQNCPPNDKKHSTMDLVLGGLKPGPTGTIDSPIPGNVFWKVGDIITHQKTGNTLEMTESGPKFTVNKVAFFDLGTTLQPCIDVGNLLTKKASYFAFYSTGALVVLDKDGAALWASSSLSAMPSPNCQITFQNADTTSDNGNLVITDTTDTTKSVIWSIWSTPQALSTANFFQKNCFPYAYSDM